jgi:hypothetical protein
MNFKNLKLPLVTVVTLSLLAPTGAFAADSVTTDGKVQFEFDTSDLKIVQPGTNAKLIQGEAVSDYNILNSGKSGSTYAYDDASGFVQLLFAPDFDFGTVKANYRDTGTYDVLKIKAQVDSAGWETGGYLNPFAQVADFTNGEADWDLNLTLNSKFHNTETEHILNTSYLHFSVGNALSDVEGFLWDAGAGNPDTKLADSTDLTYPNTINILHHDATDTNMINGAKWSYVFGSVGSPASLETKIDGAAANENVDIIGTSPARTSGVQLVVPAADKPKVGKLYTADLLWTFSATPKATALTGTYGVDDFDGNGVSGKVVIVTASNRGEFDDAIGDVLSASVDGILSGPTTFDAYAGDGVLYFDKEPGGSEAFSEISTPGTHVAYLHTTTGFFKITFTLPED